MSIKIMGFVYVHSRSNWNLEIWVFEEGGGGGGGAEDPVPGPLGPAAAGNCNFVLGKLLGPSCRPLMQRKSVGGTRRKGPGLAILTFVNKPPERKQLTNNMRFF